MCIRDRTDTESGSSGSPVFDDVWAVTALHSGSQAISGNEVEVMGTRIRQENIGIPIPAIMKKLEEDNLEIFEEIEEGQQGIEGGQV